LPPIVVVDATIERVMSWHSAVGNQKSSLCSPRSLTDWYIRASSDLRGRGRE